MEEGCKVEVEPHAALGVNQVSVPTRKKNKKMTFLNQDR